MNSLKQKEVWVEVDKPSDFRIRKKDFFTSIVGMNVEKQSGYFFTEQELKEYKNEVIAEYEANKPVAEDYFPMGRYKPTQKSKCGCLDWQEKEFCDDNCHT